MLGISKDERIGIRILTSLALVPKGPLIGAKTCLSKPFRGVMSKKLPTKSTLSFIPILPVFPKLYSQMVYVGLSGTIILVHFFT